MRPHVIVSKLRGQSRPRASRMIKRLRVVVCGFLHEDLGSETSDGQLGASLSLLDPVYSSCFGSCRVYGSSEACKPSWFYLRQVYSDPGQLLMAYTQFDAAPRFQVETSWECGLPEMLPYCPTDIAQSKMWCVSFGVPYHSLGQSCRCGFCGESDIVRHLACNLTLQTGRVI